MKALLIALFILSSFHVKAQSAKQLLRLLKTKYKREHTFVVKKYSARKRFYVSRRSRGRYKKLSRLYGFIAKRLLTRAKRRRNRRLLKQAQMFARLSSYVTPRDKRSYRVARTVKKAKEISIAERYNSSYFAFFSFMTWQDELTFTRAGSNDFTLLNTAEGMSLGLGWNYQNAKYNYFADASFTIFAKGQASQIEGDAGGWNPKRQIQAFTGGAGILFKALSEDLDFGFQGIVFYRSGDWSNVPAGATGYKTENGTLITGGLAMVSKWKLEDLAFIVKYGKLVGARSSFFALNTAYEF